MDESFHSGLRLLSKVFSNVLYDQCGDDGHGKYPFGHEETPLARPCGLPLERCRYNTISLSMEDMDVLRLSIQVDLVSDLSSTNLCNILCDRRHGRPAPTGVRILIRAGVSASLALMMIQQYATFLESVQLNNPSTHHHNASLVAAFVRCSFRSCPYPSYSIVD